MYIPADQRETNRKYPLKIRAVDNANNNLNITVVYIISDSKVYISNTSFSYNQTFDDGFYNSGIFKGKPEMVTNTSAANFNSVKDNPVLMTQASLIDKLNTISCKLIII